MGYASDLTTGGLARKQARAVEGRAGPKTAQQLITAGEAKALETGALEVSPEELEEQAAKATLGLGAVTQGTLQQLGPVGMPGTKFGKTMSDLQKFQKGIGEQVSAERMSGRALEMEIAEKRIADAKARITQAEQMRQGMVQSMTGAIVGGVVGAASIAAGSDIRLKKNISLLGQSPSGINIYKFQYLHGDQYFQGVMAQEILEKHPEAVVQEDNGYYAVYYDFVDVDFLPLSTQ